MFRASNDGEEAMTTRSDALHQFYLDVLTTFYEDPTSTWWQNNGAAERNAEKYVTKCTIREITNEATGETGAPVTIDVATIAKGFRRLQNGECSVHMSYRKTIVGSLAAKDAGDIDVVCADLVVQAALFDDIVYG
jgi:hypothetical protein